LLPSARNKPQRLSRYRVTRLAKTGQSAHQATDASQGVRLPLRKKDQGDQRLNPSEKQSAGDEHEQRPGPGEALRLDKLLELLAE